MNYKKKTLSTVLSVSFIGIFAIMLLSPIKVSAGDLGPIKIKNPLKWNSLEDLVLGLVDLAVALAAPFAMAMFVWSGIKFIRAGSEGNATKITEAKKGLFWSLIGLVLLFGAHELINFIKDYFGIS